MHDIRNRFTVFMPISNKIEDLENVKIMRTLKQSFNTSTVLLCYCNKCVNLFLLRNDYNKLINFTHRMVTKLSKNIKNESKRQLLLGHYAVISSKEGIIKDMVTNKGQLGLTCPKCLHEYFMDFSDTMHELNKDVIVTNDSTECIMTKELVNAELLLIDELFIPLFMGYTSPEHLSYLSDGRIKRKVN